MTYVATFGRDGIMLCVAAVVAGFLIANILESLR